MSGKKAVQKGAQDATLSVDYIEIRKEATAELATSSELLELVRGAKVVSPEDYEFAGSALKEVAHKVDAVTARRDERLEPFRAVVKNITATWKPVLDAYKKCEELWREKISTFAVGREQDRSALLKEASDAFAAGKEAQGQRLVSKAEDTDVPKLEGVSLSTKWIGEVIDAEALIQAVLSGAVSREVLQPNLSALLALTAARQGDPEIPGWRAYPEAAIRTSRKG